MQAWRWALSQLTRRLWLRASLYGLVAVAAALLAAVFSPFVPKALAEPFGGGTVNALLNVLASSLLSVATFSAAAMLTAYTNVANSATPRAAALISSDSRAQSALASFVGGYLYSVVAFSALGTGYYAHGGRAILFLTTIVMMGWVAIALLRWLDQLLSLARMGKAVERVEDATRRAIFGPFGAGDGRSGWSEPPQATTAVVSGQVGYVRNVDLEALRKLGRKQGLRIWVHAVPGAFMLADASLAEVEADRPLPAKLVQRLRKAFDLAGARSFDQDPRFGFVVLGEIASRALSPGINDPGTAVDVIGTAVRLLTCWRKAVEARAPADPKDPVKLMPILYEDLLDDIVRPIASDGASSLSVSLRLQKALGGLCLEAQGSPDIQSALRSAAVDAQIRAQSALDADADKRRLADVFEAHFGPAAADAPRPAPPIERRASRPL